MPYVQVMMMSAHQDDDLEEALRVGIVDLLRSTLNKEPALTVTHFIWHPRSSRTSADAREEVSISIQVTITAGTNDAAQKASFIEGAYELLRDSVPTLAEISYISVVELPSDSWGFNGRTQLDRASARRTTA